MMYGIARIMLAEGAVDQVLVLCPSNTIEAGLMEKFRSLSPGSFDLFFDSLRNGTYKEFKSKLEAELEE